MTTFAFDGRYVSADSQVNSGDTKLLSATTKLHPYRWTDARGLTNHVVYAIVGLLSPFPVLVRWHMAGADPETYPTIGGANAEDDSYDFIVVHPSVSPPSVLVYSKGCGGHPMPYKAPFAAGSGEPYARTAMHLGYDAEVGVQCGVKLDSGSGPPYEVFDTNEWRWLKRIRPVPSLSRALTRACKIGLKDRHE